MYQLTEQQQADLSAFKNCFVEHPVLTQVLSDFDRLRVNRKLGGDQQCMLLTGDTGSGKSHLINHYRELRFPAHREQSFRLNVNTHSGST